MAKTEPGATSASQSPPLLACDIVMAGGITSGLVYPGAIVELAKRYSFRSIGGTSVGAITAAVTAAAEYRRRNTTNADGFNVIAGIPEQLSERMSDGHSRLFHLFAPDPTTKPLFQLATDVQKLDLSSLDGKFNACRLVLMSSPWIWGPAALVVMIGLVNFDGTFRGGLALTPFAVAAVLAALAGGCYMLFRRWLPNLCSNGFGLCSGKARTGATAVGGAPALGLTEWISEQIQTCAGRPIDGDPLTFGDLWSAPAADEAQRQAQAASRRSDRAENDNPQARYRSIDVAMQTSDISRSHSMQLPFIESLTPLYVARETLEKYFPLSVSCWICRKSLERPKGREDRYDVPAGWVRLPEPQHVPLVFACRLSLSFPLLLSAFPMKAPDFAQTKDGRTPLKDIWFSDGGLTSNMPVHYFDAPLPAHPTFGLNLVEAEQSLADSEAAELSIPARRKDSRTVAAQPDHDDEWRLVKMTGCAAAGPIAYRELKAESGLLGFGECLLRTARLWNDYRNMLAPGTRERIVHVGLEEDEGGLNLDMPREMIARLDQRGRKAGRLLGSRFDPASTTDPATGQKAVNTFPAHRWVRLRNVLAATEAHLRRFATTRAASDAAATARGEPTLTEMMPDPPVYRMNDPVRRHAARAIDQLDALGRQLDEEAGRTTAFTAFTDAPRPAQRMVLQSVPKDPRAEQPDAPPRPAPDTTDRLG